MLWLQTDVLIDGWVISVFNYMTDCLDVCGL